MSRHLTTELAQRPAIPYAIRWLAVPIILFWVIITGIVNTVAPQLEAVGDEHAAPQMPDDAPSLIAMKRLGSDFKQYDSNSTIMIVMEAQKPLDEDAHRYYDSLIRQLSQDPKHVQHVQNFWGDPLTAAGVQSSDAKGAYVMVNIAGDLGQTLANQSVESVRDIVKRTPPPAGLKAYVTGPAALTSDTNSIANASLAKITIFSLVAITIMLLLVYRSIITTAVQLFMTGIGLSSSRGVVALLGHHNAFQISTFATNILTMLAIAAATDYGIFLVGRYQEARNAGEDRETAYYTTFRGVAPVILGSGLTIAGSMYCLSFTRLPYFKTMGVPVALGMLVVVAAALTLGPALIRVCARFGLLESKRAAQGRLWRRVATAVVRWPVPILAASTAVVLVGMLALPGYTTGYNDRYYLPKDAPVNIGYTAADRHFSQARMNPDMMLVEANHDMRNPADMLVLDRVAKNVMRVVGVAMIQDITRPLGVPLQHSSIPFQNSMQSQVLMQNMAFIKDRMDDILKMAEELQVSITTLQAMYDITNRLADTTQHMSNTTNELVAVTDQMRDHLADFDDFWRPIRSYFYWEKHCFDIPFCWSLRSLFDALDGVDQLSEKLHDMANDVDNMASITREMAAILPPMITSMQTTRAITLTLHSTFDAMINQMNSMSDTAVVMGQSFDASKNDDFFYLPPEAFQNAEFIRGLKLFLSPDGKAAQFIITQQGDPATPEGISRVDMERTAAQEGLKASSLADAKVYLGGTAATYKDIHDGEKYDLMIAVMAGFTLIFMIMLLLTRSLIAAVVIVGTAASSIAAAFGLSVLFWQDLIGLRMHWIPGALSVMILLAVGSDYNLLLVSRFKEEIHAGLKTGTIRSMASTGGVVTAAGLVFAFTMASMVASDLKTIGQSGFFICIGLLLDTLIVRSLLMPAVATLLGRWFWWPQVVHPRGVNNQRRHERLTDNTDELALAVQP